MSDPTAGAYAGDTKLFEDIGTALDTPEPAPVATPEPATPAAPPEPTETPPAPTDARPRSPDGKFKKSDEAAPAPATPVEAVVPAPEPVAESASPKTPDFTQFPAYTFQAAGRERAIPGAVRAAEGAFIPNAELAKFEQRWVQLDQAYANSSNAGRERAELQRQNDLLKQEKAAILGKMTTLVTDPNAFEQWIVDVRGNWDKLLSDAQLEVTKSELQTLRDQQASVQAQQEEAALLPQMDTALSSTVQHLMGHPEFKDYGFDAAWSKTFLERVKASLLDHVFSEATEQDVRSGLASKVGEVLFDPGPLVNEMRREAAILQRERARQDALRQAKERNAAQPVASIPVAGGKPTGSPQAKPVPTLTAKMSKRDVDKHVFESID